MWVGPDGPALLGTLIRSDSLLLRGAGTASAFVQPCVEGRSRNVDIPFSLSESNMRNRPIRDTVPDSALTTTRDSRGLFDFVGRAVIIRAANPSWTVCSSHSVSPY